MLHPFLLQEHFRTSECLVIVAQGPIVYLNIEAKLLLQVLLCSWHGTGHVVLLWKFFSCE